MAIEPRTTLKSYFEPFDKPNDQQFADLIDSLAHRTEDASLFGAGEYDPSATYTAGTIASFNGRLYEANQTTTGAFDPLHWGAFPIRAKESGLLEWDNASTYSANDLVRWYSKVYRSLAGGNLGNQPDTNPGDWQLTLTIGADPVQEWVAGLYLYGHMVRKYGQLWQWVKNGAGVWDLSGIADTFDAEVALGYWVRLLPFTGTPNVINALTGVTVPAGSQYIVHGEIEIQTEIIVEGELIIL